MQKLFLVAARPARISDAREVLFQKIVERFSQILSLRNPCGIGEFGERRDLVGRVVGDDLDLIADFHGCILTDIDRRCHTPLQKYIV